MAADRPYDIVLFGATGFTGGLTAEYLAGAVPEGTRWALAGRNRSKLEGVRSRLAKREGFDEPELLEADVTDAPSLKRIAESARVVITTVGPYIHYGDPLVAACAEAGTDYVDLTGEPEFVDRCYVRHHARAEETGARIVHACGFDSIPHDLGVLYTVKHLPARRAAEGGGLRARGGEALRRHLPIRAGRLLAPAPEPRRGQAAQAGRAAARPVAQGAAASAAARVTNPWWTHGCCRSPRSTRRSCCAQRARWRATARTSPTATTSRSSACRWPPPAWPAWARLFALAQIPPARKFLQGRMASGDGPSAEQREKSWFSVLFKGEGGGRRTVCEVSGGDPGYTETAKMLSESALCLAYDDLPETAGQVTTAQAMGDALTERLQKAGIVFTERESSAI